MLLIQHNHPISGRRYSTRVLAESSHVQASSSFDNGEGTFKLQLGLLILSDNKCNRTAGVYLDEDEVVKLIDRLMAHQSYCEQKRLEASDRELAKRAMPGELVE